MNGGKYASNVARGTMPDAESATEFILIKNVGELRATYQIRLTTYFAVQSSRKLHIYVPKECRIHTSLAKLIEETKDTIIISRG